MGKLTAAEKQRRYREKRKLDAAREEAYNAKHKERNAKRKKINEMGKRDKQKQRRDWRQYDRTRQQKQAALNSVQTPSQEGDSPSQPNGNQKRGRKTVLRNRSECVRKITKLEKKIENLNHMLKDEKRKSEKYRKRFERAIGKNMGKILGTPDEQLTPKSRTKKILHETFGRKTGKNVMKNKVARTLLFHNTLISSMRQSYKKSIENDKRAISLIFFSQKLVKRYRLQAMTSRAIGLADRKRLVFSKMKKEKIYKRQIQTFFLRDNISRNTSGLKETITRRKIKKQKRFLNAPMKSLYKKFLQEHSHAKVSYPTFTRYRPFWVLKQSDVDRNTCLCRKHENIELKAKKLKQIQVIHDDNPHNLCSFIACDKSSAKCMYNHCPQCKNNMIPMCNNDIDIEAKVNWKEWKIIKKVKEKIKRGEKIIEENTMCEKTEILGTIKELQDSFQKDMKEFKKHAFNIKAQNKAFKDCKENLKSDEAAILIDFSENYGCKLSREVQSFHFGASRTQATIHTGVLYVTGKAISFASISDSLDHSPAAIWAHLNPTFKLIKEKFPQIKILHFFSDGPSSQYRQKKNFFLFSTLLFDLSFISGTWSYFEASHGKGAADGVGGSLKRKANDYVAYGGDIPDAKSLYYFLKKDSKVSLHYVSQNQIHEISALIPEKLKTIIGTQSIHQIVTNKRGKILHRPISCFCIQNVWRKIDLCQCHLKWKEVNFLAQTNKSIKEQIYASSGSEIDESTDFLETDNKIENEIVQNHNEGKILSVTNIKSGTYVLVQFVSGARKKTKFRYVGVCQSSLNEDGEIKIMFLNISGEDNTLFKLNENDISYVEFEQIISILPQPTLKMKGDRIFYKFDQEIDVFEQNSRK